MERHDQTRSLDEIIAVTNKVYAKVDSLQLDYPMTILNANLYKAVETGQIGSFDLLRLLIETTQYAGSTIDYPLSLTRSSGRSGFFVLRLLSRYHDRAKLDPQFELHQEVEHIPGTDAQTKKELELQSNFRELISILCPYYSKEIVDEILNHGVNIKIKGMGYTNPEINRPKTPLSADQFWEKHSIKGFTGNDYEDM